jgi:hypothetical protein
VLAGALLAGAAGAATDGMVAGKTNVRAGMVVGKTNVRAGLVYGKTNPATAPATAGMVYGKTGEEV